MTSHSSTNNSQADSTFLFNEEEKIWDELRGLFVGNEKVEIDRLQRFLEDPEELSKEIARRLPRAINISREHSQDLTDTLVESLRPILEKAIISSSGKDPKALSDGLYRTLPHSINLSREKDDELTEALVEALRHIVEQSIQKSAELSIKPLSEGLYPVIGPAIRKAVTDAFRKMNQALNQSFERTLSISAVKWRIEAFSTGRPFIDVVAQHTLIFQVRQIFLIHKQTGLLLQSVNSPNSVTQDADMVSAMLTAIQDFVRDSFSVKGDENLSTIEVGEHTIWIEQGPKAILAGVVDGSAPMSLRTLFCNTLEKIHIEFSKELGQFDGDTAPFDIDTHLIEYCLQYKLKHESKKPSLAKWLLISVLIGTASYWGFERYTEYSKWTNYLYHVSNIPVVIITDHGGNNGNYFVTGLRTPQTIAPESLLNDFEMGAKIVTSKWTLYQPLTEIKLLERSRRLLKPPASVNMEFKNGELVITGEASRNWLEKTQSIIDYIWEIQTLNTENLALLEQGRIEQLEKNIEAVQFTFDSGKTTLSPANKRKLGSLAQEIKDLLSLLQSVKQDGIIQINGFTDTVGNPEINQKLSFARAVTIRDSLISSGIVSTVFSVFGHGSGTLLKGTANNGADIGRRVSISVELTKKREN